MVEEPEFSMQCWETEERLKCEIEMDKEYAASVYGPTPEHPEPAVGKPETDDFEEFEEDD